MRIISLTFLTVKGIKCGSISVDNKYIVPKIESLPMDLTDEEYRICCDMIEFIKRETK